MLYEEIVSGELTVESMLRYVVLGTKFKWKHAVTDETLLHALFRASEADPVVLTQLLIFNDCLLNEAAGDDAATPLHAAAEQNFIGSARVMLRNGADAMANNAHEQSPL